MAKIRNPQRMTGSFWIASNNLSIVTWDPLTITWGFVYKAWATDRIEWFATSDKVYPATNQTVEKLGVEISVPDDETIVEFTVTNWTISATDVWNKVYNLTATQTVDWATWATWTQLRLVKFIRSTLWAFRVVKK